MQPGCRSTPDAVRAHDGSIPVLLERRFDPGLQEARASPSWLSMVLFPGVAIPLLDRLPGSDVRSRLRRRDVFWHSEGEARRPPCSLESVPVPGATMSGRSHSVGCFWERRAAKHGRCEGKARST